MGSSISGSPVSGDETSTGWPSNARAAVSGSLCPVCADKGGVSAYDTEGVSGVLGEEEREEDCSY